MDPPVHLEKVPEVKEGRRQVHTDLNLLPIDLPPAVDGLADLLEEVPVHIPDKAGLLQHGQKIPQVQHPPLGINPAHKRLGGVDLPCAQIHLGLQVELEVPPFQGGR